MHAALRRMLTDRVTVAPFTGQDGYGMPTYGPATAYPARVEYKVRRIVDHEGQERISRARVFFDGDVVLDLRHKLTLADGTAPVIHLLYAVKDELGAIDHTEVFF